MAPPATKRRKLEHSDSEDESEGSFTGFGSTNGADSHESDAEEVADDSGFSMNELEDSDDDEDMSDGEGNHSEEEKAVREKSKSAAAAKTANEQKLHKRPASSLQDGVYTAESFKSNMFKLQVDELLEQVRPKSGKKTAPVENAMRTLKTILEQIPSRDPLPVCFRSS